MTVKDVFAVFNTKPENDDLKKLPSCFFLISEVVFAGDVFFFVVVGCCLKN